MDNDSELAFLSSVKRQFEQFQQRHVSSPGLVWLQPTADISLADALELCPLTAGVFPNGRPTGTALLSSRRDDDGHLLELMLALPPEKTVNGAFATLATEAGNCIGDAATAAGVPGSILSEKNPAARWRQILFWFALEQSGFPSQTKWCLLNLIDGSSGRYAHIRDAVRCSIYALDWLANDSTDPATNTSWPETTAGPQRVITIDPADDRVVLVGGKRVVLGRNTQIARLFCLLGDPIGVERSLSEVQFSIDGFETGHEFGQSQVEIRRAHGRVRKAVHTLRQRLKDAGADAFISIEREGTGSAATFRMIQLAPQNS